MLAIVPEETRAWFALNPMSHVVVAYREVILYQRPPDLASLGAVLAGGFALLMLARFGFRKLEKDLRDFI